VYHYGMPLDIDKVLTMSEPDTRLCDVVQASMVYLDSAGRQHTLQYLKLAQACSDQG